MRAVIKNFRSSYRGAVGWESNCSNLGGCRGAVSIPSPVQLWHRLQDSISSLGTYICCRCGHGGKKNPSYWECDWKLAFQLPFSDCRCPKMISQGNVTFLSKAELLVSIGIRSLAMFSQFGSTLKGHSNLRIPFQLAESSVVMHHKLNFLVSYLVFNL